MLLSRRIRDPFEEMRALIRSFDRMWDTFTTVPVSEERTPFARWVPWVDILETPDAHLIRMDLPGVSPEQVKVEVKDNALTVSGNREESHLEEGTVYCRQERFFGAFQRSFELPSNINTAAITADFKDGVLEIRLPKAEEAKPREVKINFKSDKSSRK